MPQERLQKILAAAGIASRRKAEEFISSGRVEVNGLVVTELGTKADPRHDHIRVDGKLLSGPERPVYLMLHKPKGYVTTASDPEGRPTVIDLVRGIPERIFPVGRLDYLSEGLLLLTNDGELMQKLTHASSHVPKTYQVKVSGRPSEENIDRLRGGILLPPEPTRAGTRGGTQEGMKRRSESVRTAPAQIDLSKDQDNPWYEITLVEGRNRQIRRMFEQIGHHVEKIKRVRYGTLELDVEPGIWRTLSQKEVARLRASIGKPFVIEPPRRRREVPQPERRELSSSAIRDLQDRAREGGAERAVRPSRPERASRAVRPSRPERASRSERPPRQERFARPARSERPSRPARPVRPAAENRERPRFDRSGPRSDRERPRSERPGVDRRERPRFDDRPPRSERPKFQREGSERPGRFEREKPRRFEGERARRFEGERSQSSRGPRPGPGARTERPRGEGPKRTQGQAFRSGTNRPRQERDSKSRPAGNTRQDRSGFGKRPPRRDNRPGKRNR